MPDTISLSVSAVLLFPPVVYRSHASLYMRHCVGPTDCFIIELPDAFHERQDGPAIGLSFEGARPTIYRQGSQVQTSEAHAARGAMPSILIIDDDDSLRDSLRRTLRKQGYVIMEASDGGLGLKQLERQAVDLVLLDLFMPDKDGLETIGELRRTHPGIKIIAMSGGGFKGKVDMLPMAKMLGARRTLTKPFTREQLLEAVDLELARA